MDGVRQVHIFKNETLKASMLNFELTHNTFKGFRLIDCKIEEDEPLMKSTKVEIITSNPNELKNRCWLL